MVPIEAPVITEQQYFDQGKGSGREEGVVSPRLV
jgi:hypothetical protein